jgi:hypothetical protein
VVSQTLLKATVCNACLAKQVDGGLLEDTGSNAAQDVLGTPLLDDDRVDVMTREKRTQKQPGRTGANDRHLCSPMDQESAPLRFAWERSLASGHTFNKAVRSMAVIRKSNTGRVPLGQQHFGRGRCQGKT